MKRRFKLSAILCALLLTTGAWASPPVQPWLPFGPDGGDARRIAPDPRNHAHLYLGTANGWIYESQNSGGSWKRLAQVGKRDDLILDSIVVDVQNPNHLVVGGHAVDRPDGGLFFTWDGGATWTNQAEMRGQAVLSLTASASDPKILVAGTLKGVFRSADGGMRWVRISPPESAEIHNVQSVAIDPKDPNIVYAGTWHLPWKSVDGGAHWDSIKQGIVEDSDVFSIIVDPIVPATVFASACSGIYKSEDGGLLFHKVQGIDPSARRTRRLLQDPHHLATVFAGTTQGLLRSDDAGKSFTRITGPEVIVNDVMVDLVDPRRVLIATDRGGVLASDDGGDTFHASNGGFSARQVSTLKRDANHPSTLFIGVLNDKDWGGVFQSDNGGQNWVQRSEGLAGRDVFALGQSPDGTLIAGTSHGLFRLDAAAETWARVESAPPSAPSSSAPSDTPKSIIAAKPHLTPPAGPGAKTTAKKAPVKPTKAQTLAAKKHTAASAKARPPARPGAKPPAVATKARSVAAKAPALPAKARSLATKSPIPPTLVPSPPRTFDGSVYSIATSNQTLLATTSSGLLSSVDEGVSWLATGPAGSVTWRYLAAAKLNVLAASLHDVHRSTDAGVSWQAVKLPERLTQISAIAIEPSGEMWVGGREGVFVSSDGGGTWTIPQNLFLSGVNNIFYDDISNRLTITTSGNSSLVFTVALPSRQVSLTDTGWNLRFARPVGDHLVAATLFDGIVVQPRAAPLAPPPARAQAATVKPSAETIQPRQE